MNVIVPLPDDFVARFGSEAELGRRVLEVLALDEYRAGRLERAELRTLLGFGTRARLDMFLKEHGVADSATIEDVERDIRDMESMGL